MPQPWASWDPSYYSLKWCKFMEKHREIIKLGHRAFGQVIHDDEDEGGAGVEEMGVDGLALPFGEGGLAHPLLADSAYFAGVDNSKMSANPQSNDNVSPDAFPHPNLQPSLDHSHEPRHVQQSTPVPTLTRK